MEALQMRSNRSRFGCRHSILVLLIALLLSFSSGRALAQTTAFTYQGRLTDGGTPANGNYDLQFTLWDSASGGSQIGSTQALPAVQVSSGVFTVTLDFGANAFPGANRFLEISARHPSDPSYTTLSPRQPITSTPYAVRSGRATLADTATNATQLGGVGASQYLQTNDSRLTDSRSPTAGSSNYIQNTANYQSSSNFNISGNGTASGTLSGSVVNAANEFDLGGNAVLRAGGFFNTFVGFSAGPVNTTGTSNTFVGVTAGQSNSAGFQNSFFGFDAGRSNVTGNNNSFFGYSAGKANNIGNSNSFFGANAGISNTNGDGNSFFGQAAGAANTVGGGNNFFGYQAGVANTTGSSNTVVGYVAGFHNTTGDGNNFFGADAGFSNATGGHNSFFGFNAGGLNTTGGHNNFFGEDAGFSNTTGNKHTIIGDFADLGIANLTNATALGANARVDCSNCLVLGSINGVNSAAADTFVGIGTTTPGAKLQVSGGAILMDNNQGLYLKNTGGAQKRVLLADTSNILRLGSGGSLGFDQVRFDLGTPGTVLTMISNGSVGIGTTAPDQLLSVNGNASKVGGGSWQVFSDERLMNIKGQFKAGLQTLRQLQPLRYEYKPNNALGLRGEGEYVGFSAQAVQRVLPEAVNRTASGYLQINNDPILWTMLNAIKEQQQEIEQLKRQLHRSRGSARGHGFHSLRKANARGLRKQ